MKGRGDAARAERSASLALDSHLHQLRGAPPGSDAQSQSLSRLLECAGDLLRYGAAGEASALRGISAAAVEAFLSRADSCCTLPARWERSAQEAIEAALGSDSPHALDGAWEALAARDALESQLAALRVWEQLDDTCRRDASARLSRTLGELDALLRPTLRAFTPLNAHRRAWRDVLVGSAREQAWWFWERAECDGLLLRLGGLEGPNPDHPRTCAACHEDLEKTGFVASPPLRHLDSQLLWALDFGALSEAEALRWRTHARACEPCGFALRTLEEISA